MDCRHCNLKHRVVVTGCRCALDRLNAVWDAAPNRFLMPRDRISCQYREESRERETRSKRVAVLVQCRTVGREELEERSVDGVTETKMRTHSSSALGNWPHFTGLDGRVLLGVEHGQLQERSRLGVQQTAGE